MFNEFPYTNYEKINLDWLLDLGNKLKEDAESGVFDGERGHGIFGITTIYPDNNQYYAINPGGVTVGDFILGYGPASGTNILYIMKVTSVTGNYVNGTTLLQITGPRGEQGPQGEPGGGGLTEAMKQALLQLARKVAYIDGNGQTYYNALYTAFYGGTPVVVLDSISAVFSQGSTVVYETDTLESLKSLLTVTAHYSDNTTEVVPSADYTLSGTLTEGTSAITVAYGGKTTTFNVAVTKKPQYIMDNLKLWLDARKYKNLANYGQITDQSGNNVALTFNNYSHIVFADTFVSVGTRGQINVESADFRAALADGWTIEMVYQNRYYDSGNVSNPANSYLADRMVCLRNGNGLLLSGTQIQIPGDNTKRGTERANYDSIIHATLTYDGTTLTEYLEGEQVYQAAHSIDIANEAFVEFFGNSGYAQSTACSWNAVRVYSKVLTVAEIKDNYNLDVANYGTVNIAEAPAGA